VHKNNENHFSNNLLLQHILHKTLWKYFLFIYEKRKYSTFKTSKAWASTRKIQLRRVWRYQMGNQNLYIEEQTTQWPKEKVQKDKQRSTKHTYKTKDWVTRTPLKTEGKLRCPGNGKQFLALKNVPLNDNNIHLIN
jgi:hypothetical protein